ncbi:MAG: hypothetical protein ABI672_04225 [Vicinamibacteria bacterium]
MNAGLPGTGIGGLFYLFSALFMPVRELWRASRGRGRAGDLRLAFRQSGMAVAILFVAWLTSRALTLAHIGNTAKETNVLAITFATLVAVVVGVEVLSLSLRVAGRIAQQLSGQAPASGGNR